MRAQNGNSRGQLPGQPSVCTRDPATATRIQMVCRGGETTSDRRRQCLVVLPNNPTRSRRQARNPDGARRGQPPVDGRRRLCQDFRQARACLLRNSTVEAGQGAGCSSGKPHRRRLASISAAVRQADSISLPRSSSDNRLSAANSSSKKVALGFVGAPFSKADDMVYSHLLARLISHPKFGRSSPVMYDCNNVAGLQGMRLACLG